MEIAGETARTRSEPLARATWTTALIALALGAIALVPRVAGLADFLTTDEAYNWLPRIGGFSGAIADGRWGDTVLTGHPGVTLLWLGELGLALERAAVAADWANAQSAVAHLAWLRLPVAVLQALCVPIGYLLLRRLLAPTIAIIAALLWAMSPYLVAYSRFYHLDGLLTTFVTLSVLCILVGCRSAHARRWVAAAGGLTGLALLTKGSALIVLPIVGLLLLWQIPAPTWGARVRRTIGLYALWLALAVAVFALLWPAMWVDPRHAIRSFFTIIISNGGRLNGDGQFFLGRAVADPGLLFYLVGGLFHMTPAMLIGLLGLPLALRRRTTDDGQDSTFQQLALSLSKGSNVPTACPEPIEGFQRSWSEQQRSLLALALFTLIWTLVMTLGPKKFDRYTLPTWPALLALSAAGWKFWLWDAGAWVRARWPRFATRGASVGRYALIAAILGLEGCTLAWYHPYYLSYFNPLLGGGAAAQHALLIGWGEGMDQVGAYLSARPDIGYGPVLSALPATLQPFVPVPVKDVLDVDDAPANYAVVYVDAAQLEENAEIYARLRQTQPLHRVTIHGIDYAEIYQPPRPFERAIGARFGEALLLRGVTVARAPGRRVVTPAWDVRARPPADYQAFVHLIDGSGRIVAQVDILPGGGGSPPTSTWETGQQIAVPLPVALPDGLSEGTYQLTFGLYDVQTGQRLSFTGGIAADPALDGPNALLLDTVTLP